MIDDDDTRHRILTARVPGRVDKLFINYVDNSKLDGMGFAPVMCEHAHGSTGICGPFYIDNGVWGPAWDDHMLVCNPVTSRINHDIITWTGATPKAVEQPDFVVSDDLWFRPVDVRMGPDGALWFTNHGTGVVGRRERRQQGLLAALLDEAPHELLGVLLEYVVDLVEEGVDGAPDREFDDTPDDFGRLGVREAPCQHTRCSNGRRRKGSSNDEVCGRDPRVSPRTYVWRVCRLPPLIHGDVVATYQHRRLQG